MNLKEKIIKLLGGYTQLEFDSKAQDIKNNVETVITKTPCFKGYLNDLSRNNLLIMELIDRLIIVQNVLREDKEEPENNEFIFDKCINIKDFIERSNVDIIEMCKESNVDISFDYIAPIAAITWNTQLMGFYPHISSGKEIRYRIKILSLDIEVIAAVETDIYFNSLHFCFKYISDSPIGFRYIYNTKQKKYTNYIHPYEVRVISSHFYHQLDIGQLI